MRVQNPIGKNNQSNGFRCTVCGAETKSNISIVPKINKILQEEPFVIANLAETC